MRVYWLAVVGVGVGISVFPRKQGLHLDAVLERTKYHVDDRAGARPVGRAGDRGAVDGRNAATAAISGERTDLDALRECGSSDEQEHDQVARFPNCVSI